MGLAYDLNTQPFPNWFISNWELVLRQGDFNLFKSLNTGGRGDDIFFPSPSEASYSEFDVVIRNTTYVQDFYVVCGSYRAFFQELNGGAGAWAWDGFVTLIRAHNVSQRSLIEAFYYENFEPSQLSKLTNFWLQPAIVDGFVVSQPFSSYENAFFTYLCRMPYEVEPDLTGLGSDKTPGVYAVDVVSDGEGGKIKIMAAGHQRIASSEGMLSSQNYSAWISQIDFGYNPAIVLRNFGSPEPGGKSTEQPFEVTYSNTGFQVSWKADQANHVGRYLPNSKQYPSTVYALEDLAHSINTTTPITATFNFVNLTTLSNGFYLSRIHDVVVINGGPFPLSFSSTDSTGITICITGEAIADDGAGSVDFTTPSLGFWQPNNAGTPPQRFNQLYTALGSENFGLDSSVSYDLDGSYGTIIMPTFSESPDPKLTNLAVGLDRVTYGATTSTAIYATNFEIALGCFSHPAPNKPDPDQVICPFAIKGGGFETATGFSMPDKWYGKAVQQATYSRTDEATAKNASVYPQVTDSEGYQTLTAYPDRNLQLLLETDPTLGGLEPDPLNFLASVYPENRYAYGLGNTPYAGPGQPANVAYGFLGYTAGVGPVIFMYDFGTLYIRATNTSPVRFELSDGVFPVPLDVISVGSSINAAIQTGGTATARRPVSARWDADRDQWIFTFADDVSGSLVSCNSAFDRQSPNQIAYLDQTDQFSNLDSDQRSSLYISRNMTPFLDGLVLFGGSLDTTALGQATMTSILIPSNDPNETTDSRGFQSFIINGTTGRSANVWVDYLLFDGVDSLIAVELQNLGLRVTVENVEWYKAKILRRGKLGITPEEIEDWVRSQQTEYRETLKLKERQGRLRTRRRQQAAWREGLEDTLSGDFQETTGFDSLESLDRASETFVPSASESAPKSGDKSKKHSSIQKSNSDKKQNRDS